MKKKVMKRKIKLLELQVRNVTLYFNSLMQESAAMSQVLEDLGGSFNLLSAQVNRMGSTRIKALTSPVEEQ